MACRVHFGPRWSEGIIDIQPPKLGQPFPTLLPQVDILGNDLGGVETVELLAPLATYTPWNLRHGYPGGTDELTDFRGTLIPLPKTERDRQANGDPRPSIESLYFSKEDYLLTVQQAAQALFRKGFLLEEDFSTVRDRASMYWDRIFQN